MDSIINNLHKDKRVDNQVKLMNCHINKTVKGSKAYHHHKVENNYIIKEFMVIISTSTFRQFKVSTKDK